MARQLDARLQEILQQYHPNPKAAVWDCHGVWVIYHKAIELIAAKAGVTFSSPTIIEANAEKKIVSLCVFGHLGDHTEWSIGEAAPYNNKNGYPFAMAEKRGKDRVVLKLIGLHGEIYSEDEADDFKQQDNKEPTQDQLANEETSHEQREGMFFQIDDIWNLDELQTWGKTKAAEIASLTEADQREVRKHFTAKRNKIKAKAA